MPATTTLSLALTDSGSAFGLEVTFSGAVPVHYRERPPQGSVILDFTFAGRSERAVWMQSDWAEPHEVFGFGYRVLNPPELKPRVLSLEITDPNRSTP